VNKYASVQHARDALPDSLFESVTIKPAVPATLVATLAIERKPGSTSWSLLRDHCRCLADLVGRLLHFDVYVSRTHVESVESDSYFRL
jgi:hypothetical protein